MKNYNKFSFLKTITDEYTQISFEQAKPYYLEMLDYLHSFCEKNDIKYMIYFGTLLGAVRHKGFIPWDDDMDICMLREDYDKFIKIFNKFSERYKIITWRTKYCWCPYAKIVDLEIPLSESPELPNIGIFIDIFPIDNEGKTLSESKRFMHFVSFNIYFHQIAKNAPQVHPFKSKKKIIFWKIIKPFVFVLYFILSKRDGFYKLIDKISKLKKNKKNIVYAGCVNASTYNERQILKKEWFSERVLYDFEDRRYYGPKDYDNILTTIYHEYMQFPPEEHRQHHSQTKIWIKKDLINERF